MVFEPPRTSSGNPDLQDVQTHKTLTPMSRHSEFTEIRTLSAEQTGRLGDGHQEYLEVEFAASNPQTVRPVMYNDNSQLV